MMNRILSLDDLPRYSHWPRTLLSLEEMAVKVKTPSEIEREFNRDKWGRLLSHTYSHPAATLSDIDELDAPACDEALFFDNGQFMLTTGDFVFRRTLELYEETLRPHLNGATCLVELGAGYGSKILNLAIRPPFSALPLYAAEYTETGRALITLLGRSMGYKIEVGYCDFFDLQIRDIAIPEGAVIFTSSSVHYVPWLSEKFTEFIAAVKPRAVIHFEPCFEHYAADSLHGLLCRRYVMLNDYSRNIASVIENAARGKKIEIINVRQQVQGSPFLPISVIEWRPR